MTILHESMWRTPRELSGVKSRKRAVFEIPLGSVDATSNAGIHRVSGLKVTLESRICALGPGGHLAVELLLGRPLKGKVHRHEGLQVAHLGSHLAGNEANIGEHLAAVNAVLETRPQVVVLDSEGTSSWTKAFEMLLEAREGIHSFRGAVILVVEEESDAVKDLCTQRWRQGGSWLWQEAMKQGVQDLMVLEDVLEDITDEVETMLGKVRQLSAEAFFGEDSVQKSRERGWSLCLLIDQTASETADRFCGFMCYQLSSKSAEFHIARIAVIARSRGKGYGKHFMQWALEKCSLLPRSTCAWISLSALDEAVPFYEQFGFTDMTCDDLDDDEHIQTWMELKNISVASEPDDSDNDNE